MNRPAHFDSSVPQPVEILNTEPPPEAIARMRLQLDGLRSRMESAPEPESGRPWRTSRHFIRWTLLAATAVALLLVGIFLSFGSSTALAQIVEAVSQKNWLHAEGTGPNGEKAELWFSAKKGIVAGRTGDSYVFVDQVQGTMDLFGPPAAPDQVQRFSLEHVRGEGIAAARESFLALLAGDLQNAMQAGGNQVLEHNTRTVRMDRRELTEHRYLVGVRGEKGLQTTSLLQVDPKTGLPVTWQMKQGERPLFDLRVSYPERGPLTITALGVPRSAQIVSSTPQREFKQILISGNGARSRFDDYQAIVVESHRVDRATPMDDVFRIWRKGNRWRVDQLRFNSGIREEGDSEEESRAWWLRQSRSMKSFPREICDGTRIYTFEPKYSEPKRPDPNDPQFLVIDQLTVTRSTIMDRKQLRSPRFMLNLPEMYGYEPLDRFASFGFRAEAKEVKYRELTATQVRVQVTGNAQPNTVSPQLYWLDHQRGDVMVRKEHYRTSEPNVPFAVSEIASAKQTPQGLWYPSTVRLVGNSVSLDDNSRSDSFVRYYLDFEADTPDEMFRAESIDVKNFWWEQR
ncbi:MAG: hypothetical protein NT069_11800 [Planctomycetota bacterium]|nr:hypothetical protein [Planctomycetota bacterium]